MRDDGFGTLGNGLEQQNMTKTIVNGDKNHLMTTFWIMKVHKGYFNAEIGYESVQRQVLNIRCILRAMEY